MVRKSLAEHKLRVTKRCLSIQLGGRVKEFDQNCNVISLLKAKDLMAIQRDGPGSCTSSLEEAEVYLDLETVACHCRLEFLSS